jgi:hypothetical protein
MGGCRSDIGRTTTRRPPPGQPKRGRTPPPAGPPLRSTTRGAPISSLDGEAELDRGPRAQGSAPALDTARATRRSRALIVPTQHRPRIRTATPKAPPSPEAVSKATAAWRSSPINAPPWSASATRGSSTTPSSDGSKPDSTLRNSNCRALETWSDVGLRAGVATGSVPRASRSEVRSAGRSELGGYDGEPLFGNGRSVNRS